jgi:hypothetical protein
VGLRAIGFFSESSQTCGMNWHSFRRSSVAFVQRAGLSAVAIAASLVLLSSGAWANGAGVLLAHRDSACYCHCGMSKARGGCVKMCEMPKYASRWWATSCAIPKTKVSKDASKVGPRFPRPGRAERAAVDGAAVGESR